MLIALVGVKNSGKDAIADIIQRHIKANRTAFANKIKDVCSNHFELDLNYFNDRELKEGKIPNPEKLGYIRCLDILEDFKIETSSLTTEQSNYVAVLANKEIDTPRLMMQIVGTQLLRYFDNEIHCKSIDLNKLAGVNIVTDVRMPNELKHLSTYNGKFIPLYVQRDNAEILINDSSHESEKNVFLIRDNCVKVSNNGSLEDLENTVVELLKLKGQYD